MKWPSELSVCSLLCWHLGEIFSWKAIEKLELLEYFLRKFIFCNRNLRVCTLEMESGGMGSVVRAPTLTIWDPRFSPPHPCSYIHSAISSYCQKSFPKRGYKMNVLVVLGRCDSGSVGLNLYTPANNLGSIFSCHLMVRGLLINLVL